MSRPAGLLRAARGGDRATLARLLSIVERGGAPGVELASLVGSGEGSYSVGLTGAPGAGKSTLTSALLGVIRSHDERVAVIAIDPTSPFSGGAILGDRLRMQDHALDDGVYIRSMATRGHLGGLSLAVPEAVRVLAAVGWPLVLIETVGVGQVEVEVAGSADTCVVVVNPGWGDAVQANKAGLMEIADVFVINKADRDGTAQTRDDLEAMLELAARPDDGWRPPIVEAVATADRGVDDVWSAICAHRDAIESSGELARRRAARRVTELRNTVVRTLERVAREGIGPTAWHAAESAVAAGTTSPAAAAESLLAPLLDRS
ncbi:MAG: methylmalonyl Co-A mutase-associated GTPase MeaB [Ilumatobacteraceae bacterium]